MLAEGRAPEGELRVGVLGSGVMGEKHLEAWRVLGAPVHGIYARNAERGRLLGTQYGCAVYDSLPALLSEVDIADICLPTFLHRMAVDQAVQAGCQIVCEKPLALRYEDGEAMFKTCDAANVRLFVAMVVRFFPAYRAVWNKVHSGSLGALKEIALKRTVPVQAEDKSWFADDSLSGGVIFDLLIHDVDYAMWLAGDVVKVHAQRERVARNQSAHLTLEHASGTISRIDGGWFDSATDLETTLSVTGAQGKIDAGSGIPEAAAAGQDRSKDPSEDPYVEQLRHFQVALGNHTPFEVTRQQVLQVMRVTIAAQEAARCKRPIHLEPETRL